MGNYLNFSVIAEGIEKEEQVNFLKHLKDFLIKGFVDNQSAIL
ncbi:hypothetical protein FU659_05635 [Paenibacillus sp. N3.4]|nr:hypothetical protein FU659_05635 [Paenibacillus sp. N3.4]